MKIYNTMIRPIIEYAAPIWYPTLTQTQKNKINRIDRKCIRIAHRLHYRQTLDNITYNPIQTRLHKITERYIQKAIDINPLIQKYITTNKQTPRQMRKKESLITKLISISESSG
jgi:hypothetical protein